MNEVYIVGIQRTPVGAFNGKLASVKATELGAIALKAALAQAGVPASSVDEVFMGNVMSANLGQAPATQVALAAGLPDTVPCTTINKVCASGTKAAMLAANMIRLGDAHIVVAGGMENMSQVPHYVQSYRTGHKFGNTELLDGVVKDGLQDVYSGMMMGEAAELCAAKYSISREAQDEYAIRSYKRAIEATENGSLKPYISPVTIQGRKGDVIVDTDEEPANVLWDKIPTLKPAFKKEGTITAANASKLNDGATAMILASEKAVKELGLKPLARIVSYADAALKPEWFTIAPNDAVRLALKRAGLKAADMSFFEINEAFSVVAMANQQLLEVDAEAVNPFGGAVAFGHPLGSSGARLIQSMVTGLKLRGGKYAAMGICNGGGGASAMVLENV
ncbi:MAG: acetyl-CoA C-acyltransferase [Sphingobacteriia bacterium]|jgi:acetyl-CoA C-acetyltransferase